MRILHIVSLMSDDGEYGGPAKVAQEIAAELSNRSHSVLLLAGSRNRDLKSDYGNLVVEKIKVKTYLKKLKFSSMYSHKFFFKLLINIKNADIVHIHFGREILSFMSAILCVILRKPFVIQTHGMCVPSDRLFLQFIDKTATTNLLNRSLKLILLSAKEETEMQNHNLQVASIIIPNGIGKNALKKRKWPAETARVAFCSRLHPQKGVIKFIEVAKSFNSYDPFGVNIYFEIFGPDGGDLPKVMNILSKLGAETKISYKTSLNNQEVLDMLRQVDVLILPSKKDAYPMVILEAMSVGTSILVMPSCGFSQLISKFEPNFVAKSEDVEGLIIALKNQFKVGLREPKEIQDFARQNFSLKSLVDVLEQVYTEKI